MLRKLLVEHQTVEVRIWALPVGGHKGEKLRDHIEISLLNRNVFRKDELEIAFHFWLGLVETEKHFRFQVELLEDPACVIHFGLESLLLKASDEKVPNDVVAVRLHAGSVLHLYIIHHN